MRLCTIQGTALLICISACSVWGQLPPGGSAQGSSRPTPLPLSGRSNQEGSVETQQSAGASGVSTINSSVQVNGNYSGSVLSSTAPGLIKLTLADAVNRGLQANLGTISANLSVRAARAERIQALSALLPNISANASETITQVNLAAYGFQFKIPASVGFSIPSVVGPFAYSQAQGALSQSIYDPVSIRNWQASKETQRASALSAKDARELVVLAVSGTYLQTVASAARVASQQVQVDNAQAVYQQAVVRKEAGIDARIDVVRTLVELQTQQQRLGSLQGDLRKQKITLARIIGLPLDRDIDLVQSLNAAQTGLPDAAAQIQRAFKYRSDLQAAAAQVSAAERALSAARAERLPSASLNGDYGLLGPNPASVHGVFAVTASVNLPIWQGGRTKGDIQEAETALHQRQAEFADQRGRVEQEVRVALIELETATGQVRLAASNRDYASETLTEARDRFNAGITTTVEVVQAQEQVASAESDYISSLFSFDLAKLTLARSTGDVENEFSRSIEGSTP